MAVSISLMKDIAIDMRYACMLYSCGVMVTFGIGGF